MHLFVFCVGVTALVEIVACQRFKDLVRLSNETSLAVGTVRLVTANVLTRPHVVETNPFRFLDVALAADLSFHALRIRNHRDGTG